jgi:hypothetical protein
MIRPNRLGHSLLLAVAFVVLAGASRGAAAARGQTAGQVISPAAISTSDYLRLVLQTNGGLAAYAVVTGTLSLNYVRPLFAAVEHESSGWLQGSYLLSGRNEAVQLAIGTAGWVLAYHPRSVQSQYLFDCLAAAGPEPEHVLSRPERALLEVAAALGTPEPGLSYFDFRHPQATNIVQHWLYRPSVGASDSSIHLPLANSYLDRGYSFCTALSSSSLRLNGEIIDQQGYTNQPVVRYGPLLASQLRAGQWNALRIESTFSLIGTGLFGGVSLVYTGDAPTETSGGYVRTLPLAWPAFLGEPVPLYQVFMPAIKR